MKKTERMSNFELMRIFMMLGIIAHHFVVNSGITTLYNLETAPWKMIFCQIYGGYGKTIINCFTLITGYFMVKSSISREKFLKMYLPYKFYYLLFFVIFAVTGYEAFSVKNFMLTFFSVFYEAGRRYTGTYVVFFLFIPFLNILARGMSKKQYQLFLGLCLLYMSISPTLFAYYFGRDTFDFLGWMMITYLIGGYISLYPCKWFESFRFALVGLIVTFGLSVLWVLGVDFYGLKHGFGYGGYLTSDSNRILAIGIALFVFLFYKNLKMGYHKWINYAASSTFGILIIHSNSDVMRRFLWGTVLHSTQHYEMRTRVFVIFAIAAVLSVYVVCLILDKIRIRLIDQPLFDLMRKKGWI